MATARTSRPRTRRRNLTPIIIAALAIGLLSSCASDDDDGLPPPQSPGADQPSPTPTLELTTEEQEAVDEVRALFDEFMHAYIALATSGDPPDQDAMLPVAGLLTHPLEGEVITELVDNYVADRRLNGTLTWTTVSVVEVELQPADDERDPEVTLQICLDATDWITASKATDEVEEISSQLFKQGAYLVTVRATYFDPMSLDNASPRWFFGVWESELDASC